MHVFSHQFPISCEKTVKPIEWGKPGKLVLQNPSHAENLGEIGARTFSYSMGAFSIRFPFYVYFITWEVHGFSHQISHSIRKVSKTHGIEKAWEIDSHNFSIKWVFF